MTSDITANLYSDLKLGTDKALSLKITELIYIAQFDTVSDFRYYS